MGEITNEDNAGTQKKILLICLIILVCVAVVIVELFDKYGLIPIRTDISGDILSISGGNNIEVVLGD